MVVVPCLLRQPSQPIQPIPNACTQDIPHTLHTWWNLAHAALNCRPPTPIRTTPNTCSPANHNVLQQTIHSSHDKCNANKRWRWHTTNQNQIHTWYSRSAPSERYHTEPPTPAWKQQEAHYTKTAPLSNLDSTPTVPCSKTQADARRNHRMPTKQQQSNTCSSNPPTTVYASITNHQS